MRSIILILLLFGMFACQKENKVEPRIDTTFLVRINGADWNGVTGIFINKNTDTLTIYGSANSPKEEFIRMKIKFQGLGQYSLTKNQGYYLSTLGGDVRMSEYKLTSNLNGQLVITKYDLEENYIEGNFEMILEKHYSYLANDSDTLNLVNGNFKGKIRSEN